MDFSLWAIAKQLKDGKDKMFDKRQKALAVKEAYADLLNSEDPPPDPTPPEVDKILDFSFGIIIFFIVLGILLVVLSVVALYLLVVRWHKLKDWVKAVGIVALLMGFPYVTIIVILATTKK